MLSESRKFLLKTLRPFVPTFLLLLPISILGSVLRVISGDLVSRLINAAVAADVEQIVHTVKMVAGIGLAAASVSWIATYLTEATIESVWYKFRNDSVKHLLNVQSTYLRGDRIGDILSRLSGDMEALPRMVRNTMTVVVGLSTTLIAAAYLLAKSPLLSLIVFVGMPATTVLSRRLAEPIAGHARIALETLGRINVVVRDALNRAATIKVSSQERHWFLSRFEKLQTSWLDRVKNANRISSLLTAVGLFGMFVPNILIFGIGGGLARSGKVEYGVLFSFLMLLDLTMFPFSSLPRLLAEIRADRSAIARLGYLMDLPIERKDGADPGLVEGQPVLRFQDVVFRYESCDTQALRGVTMEVWPGEHVAIVGPSGSGKSTLVRLLLGEVRPDSGAVYFGGTKIDDWNLGCLRRRIAVLFQEPHVFAGSVADNLFWEDSQESRQVSDTILEGLRREVAGFENFILEQDGRNLSGGQRQRLALARTLQKKADLYVLDEPTSSLDADLAHEIMESIHDALKGKTLLVITHDARLTCRSHRVFQLADGAIRATDDITLTAEES